ncbi:hypothetical protein U1Q18_001279 [Sarracenia purpurea var. burkii]
MLVPGACRSDARCVAKLRPLLPASGHPVGAEKLQRKRERSCSLPDLDWPSGPWSRLHEFADLVAGLGLSARYCRSVGGTERELSSGWGIQFPGGAEMGHSKEDEKELPGRPSLEGAHLLSLSSDFQSSVGRLPDPDGTAAREICLVIFLLLAM